MNFYYEKENVFKKDLKILIIENFQPKSPILKISASFCDWGLSFFLHTIVFEHIQEKAKSFGARYRVAAIFCPNSAKKNSYELASPVSLKIQQIRMVNGAFNLKNLN